MKRGIIIPTLVILTVFLISVVSAEIILTKELESFYNLGDIVDMPVKITSLNNLKGFFTISLICNGQEIEIHKQYVMLSTGEEKEIKPLIPLIRSFIGRSTGTCTIKSSLGEEYVLSNEFKISNLIIVKPKTEKTEFLPEQSLIIEGDAKKENGKPRPRRNPPLSC
ncbi:MAG: hypothetical protein ACE5ES_05630, partial [Candidatus Nanoarchaeia archaeon]